MTRELTLEEIADALAHRAMLVEENAKPSGLDSGLHQHPIGQLLGSSRGLLSVSTPAGSWLLPSTHCMWIPPAHIHAVRSHGAFAGWSLFVAEPIAADLPQIAQAMRTPSLLREAIRRLGSLPLQPQTRRHHHLEQLILDELVHMPAEALQLTAPSSPSLRRITDKIVLDFTIKRDLDEWARWAGLSGRTVSRKFTAETGLSFRAWQQRARLLRAMELLAEGQSVTTVAIDLGYSNVSAFIALFRRTYGMTPAAYVRGTA